MSWWAPIEGFEVNFKKIGIKCLINSSIHGITQIIESKNIIIKIIWTILSLLDEQIRHLGSVPLSLASLSPVRMSPVKNLTCALNFCISLESVIPAMIGWGFPERPWSLTFRNSILELPSASFLNFCS